MIQQFLLKLALIHVAIVQLKVVLEDGSVGGILKRNIRHVFTVQKLSDDISEADIMIKKESRQNFGCLGVGIFAVLVLDPLQAERGVFLSLHLGKLGRIGA